MISHGFAAAVESGDRAAIAALFAEDVTYHTPVLTADLHGKDLTLRFLAEGTRVVDDLKYTDEVSDDERTILFWKGILDQREISGATVLAGEAGGLIRDITVLQRPWGVAANFRDATLRALTDVVPLPAWQLDDRRAPAADPDAGAGQRPGGPLPLAPTVAFHGAMLTRTLYGQENVEAVHKLIDGIQGMRTYLARFTSTDRLVEYWNCVIDGHLLQGIDDFKLDDNGRVTDQTVWLRPWPVVTVLRDRAIAGKLPFLPADYWRLRAGPTNLS
jgi:SnoaL-like domain